MWAPCGANQKAHAGSQAEAAAACNMRQILWVAGLQVSEEAFKKQNATGFTVAKLVPDATVEVILSVLSRKTWIARCAFPLFCFIYDHYKLQLHFQVFFFYIFKIK